MRKGIKILKNSHYFLRNLTLPIMFINPSPNVEVPTVLFPPSVDTSAPISAALQQLTPARLEEIRHHAMSAVTKLGEQVKRIEAVQQKSSRFDVSSTVMIKRSDGLEKASKAMGKIIPTTEKAGGEPAEIPEHVSIIRAFGL
jgi:hypothetical protein